MADTVELLSEIKRRFPFTPLDEESLADVCLQLCKAHTLSPEDLFFKWEALRYSNRTSSSLASGSSVVITAGHINALKAQLQREAQKKARSQLPARTQVKLAPSLGSLTSGLVPGSRILKQPTPAAVANAVDFSVLSDPNDYRYMYEKVTDKSAYLDDLIDDMAELVKTEYKISDLADPSSVSEEEVLVVGRICFDAAAADSSSKLNEGNIFLESSRMMGSGARVRLQFDPSLGFRNMVKGTSSFGIFPGAILPLKGRNGSGDCFVAKEVLCLPSLKPSPRTFVKSTRSRSFSVCISCGPYTSDDNLEYKEFASLCRHFRAVLPDVIILLGPFVDSSHSLIKSGNSDQPSEEIFQERILGKLLPLLDQSPKTQVYFVPSVKDTLSKHVVFPQSSKMALSTAHRQMQTLSNPCRFSVFGVGFGVCSVDTLFHLQKQQLVLRGIELDPKNVDKETQNDMLANTSRHVLQQRSFYPLYPVPMELSHEVNLDVSHSEALRLDSSSGHSPDVLILPSRLKHFSKIVESTLVINPSFAFKGKFTHLTVDPGNSAQPFSCEFIKLSDGGTS